MCLYDVVKTLNYQNCAGVGKGVYSIDQSSPYYLGGESDNMLAVSWNHHDAQYNQMTAGGNNLVVSIASCRAGNSGLGTASRSRLTTITLWSSSQRYLTVIP